MPTDPFALPSIPLLNQPVTVYGDTAAVSIVIKCNCDAANPPFVLRGTDVGGLCSRCGNVYQIVRAAYDIRQNIDGLPLVGVAITGRQKTEETARDN